MHCASYWRAVTELKLELDKLKSIRSSDEEVKHQCDSLTRLIWGINSESMVWKQWLPAPRKQLSALKFDYATPDKSIRDNPSPNLTCVMYTLCSKNAVI